MGQLEKYGLYVLCLLIFLILGVTLMGSGTVEARPDGDRERQQQDLNAGRSGGPGSNAEPAGGDYTGGNRANGADPNGGVAQGNAGATARAPNFSELLTPASRPSNPAANVVDPNGRRPFRPINPSVGNPSVGNPPAAEPPVSNDPANATPKPVAVADRPTYTVRRGDTYESIARELFGTRALIGEIARLNPRLDPKKLQESKKILVPTQTEADAFIAQRAAKRAGVQLGGTYTIQKGDTLIGIAERQLGSERRLKDLQALNPGVNPMTLRIGQKIRLPRK